MPDDAPPPSGTDRFEDYTSYQDGDALVITDRSNPNAWIRSDVTVDVDDAPARDETESRPASPR